jgi:crotonobetainyl-CoA:carnitine CoA-transferase CaiB-like acyl-CoA transferase
MTLRTAKSRRHDPHMQARQTHVAIDHSGSGLAVSSQHPLAYERAPPRIQGPAPQVGQHNAYILGDLLGLSPQAQQQLEADGIL